MKINKNRLRALVREELSRSMKNSQRRLAEVEIPDDSPEADAALSAAEAEAAREELRRFKMSVEDRLAAQIDGVNNEGEQIPPLSDTDVRLMLRGIYNSADDGNKGTPVEVVFEDVVDGGRAGRGAGVQESVTHLAWPARITVRYQPTNYDYQIGVRVQRLERGPSGALQVGEVLPFTSGYMMNALNEPELQDEWYRGWGARYADILQRYDFDSGIRGLAGRQMYDQAYIDQVNRHFGYEENDPEFLVLPLGQDNIGPAGHTGDFDEALYMYLAEKGNSVTVEVDTDAITDPESFAQIAQMFGFTTVSNSPEEGTRAAEELFQSAGLE